MKLYYCPYCHNSVGGPQGHHGDAKYEVRKCVWCGRDFKVPTIWRMTRKEAGWYLLVGSVVSLACGAVFLGVFHGFDDNHGWVCSFLLLAWFLGSCVALTGGANLLQMLFSGKDHMYGDE